ncbi:MAG: endonuclease III domain-containing protein [Deltaproteobacteria bacterium]|jgi:endonuclease-3 related protein|nr:endonuclease III domain-containing protein [Deltaproteobacteria bacterium]
MDIYHRLNAFFGPRHWWPGDSPFEVMVGAILTQNTSWRNVEKAIDNLSRLALLTPEAIEAAPTDTLAQALRPSGYYNIKKDRLLSLVRLVLENGRGGADPEILRWPISKLRSALLEVKGIGPETADSIVLYAANKPSFVVDLYTRRLFSRHGLILGSESYQDIRSWFMENLVCDAALFNQYHALIVAAGNKLCKPKTPLCNMCPLGDDVFLDESLLV